MRAQTPTTSQRERLSPTTPSTPAETINTSRLDQTTSTPVSTPINSVQQVQSTSPQMEHIQHTRVVDITPLSPSPSVDTQPNHPEILIDLSDVLKAENKRLKEELGKLQKEKKDILDHSIESDMRLLRYTNEVFTTNCPPAYTQTTVKSNKYCQTETIVGQPCTTSSDESLSISNRKLVDDLSAANKTIQLLKQEIEKLSTPCPTCTILKEESANMITAIRCLENQIKSMHNSHPSQSNNRPEHTHSLPTSSPSITLQNSFQPLSSDNLDAEDFTVIKHRKRIRNIKKKPAKRKSKNQFQKNICHPIAPPFKKVTILGDSHARHVAGMVRDIMKTTTVSGVCKPGAGLLNVVSPPISKTPDDHCYVLIAGSNDVASGNQRVLLNHMKDVLRQFSRVVVCTLPQRHDLAPYHPVNRAVSNVNNFITETFSGHKGVMVLDIGCIQRHAFTTHGMHLRANGKRRLARMITVAVTGMPPPTLYRLTEPPKDVKKMTSSKTSWKPRECDPRSYAEATKQFMENSYKHRLPQESNSLSSSSFLERTATVSSLMRDGAAHPN